MPDPDKVIEFKLTDKFRHFLKEVHKQHPTKIDVLGQRISSLDPGETTGTSTYDGIDTIQVSQWNTKSVTASYDKLVKHLGDFSPDQLRYEDYRVYSWKAEEHSWSPVHTIRWIGAIQVAAYVTHTDSSYIMATHAKGFWGDNKLDLFGLNPKGLKHGRDALRHLLYYMCFPESGSHVNV